MLFPKIEPYKKHFLKVSEDHTLYFEESGNPDGSPCLFLHGGPGGATESKHRRFFNPQKYRIILLDQRGCGKSTPTALTKDNNTTELIKDLERVRSFLEIPQWSLVGSSWGTTLALLYAQAFPERINRMILKGIFLARRKDTLWTCGQGAEKELPEAWKECSSLLNKEEQKDFLKSYHSKIHNPDMNISSNACAAWARWELHLYVHTWPEKEKNKLLNAESSPELKKYLETVVKLETHYFYHDCFIDPLKGALKDIRKIENIPTDIIHGCRDRITPIQQAHLLEKALKNVRTHYIENGDHSTREPKLLEAFLKAINS